MSNRWKPETWMKWIKSEGAPNVCTLLVDEQATCIGMVQYDKHAQLESRWKAIVMPEGNTVGVAQTKLTAQGLLLVYISDTKKPSTRE